jgi:hypothetical protein
MIEGCLWIVDLKVCALLEKVMTYLHGWRLSWVVGVFFESSTEYANFLAFEVEIKRLKDSEEEIFLTVLVYLNNCVPVVCYFSQPLHLSQID